MLAIAFSALSVVCFLSATIIFSKFFGRSGSRDAWCIAGIIILSALIIGSGYFLSAFGALASLGGWALCSAGALSAALALDRLYASSTQKTLGDDGRRPLSINSESLKTLASRLSWPFILGFSFLIIVLFASIVINVDTIRTVASTHADSISYHLPRIQYYLQYGSLDRYPANYWAQVDHPKNATILNTFVYLISQKHANFVQSVQCFSWLTIGLCLFAILRRVGVDMIVALTGAALFMLAINVLLESTTPQNDLVVASFMALAVFSFIEAVRTRIVAWIYLFGIALGMSIGTKLSALLFIPSAYIVVLSFLLKSALDGMRGRQLVFFLTHMVVATLIGVALFSLPAGYLDNYRQHGNVLGGEDVIKHSLSVHAPTMAAYLSAGSANIVRVSIDLLRPDGLPTQLEFLNHIHRFLVSRITAISIDLGIDIIDSPKREPYNFFKNIEPRLNRDLSFPGPLMLFLVLPSILWGVVTRNRNIMFWAFVLASLILIVAQGFAGPYDRWRGRYLTAGLIFFIPATMIAIGTWPYRRLGAIFLSFSLVMIGWSAANALVDRSERYAFGATEQSIRTITAARRYEALVPPGSTVLSITGPHFEHLFFGKRQTRYLIAGGKWPELDPRDQNRKPDFVLFRRRTLPVKRCDVLLPFAKPLYLRKLDECPL